MTLGWARTVVLLAALASVGLTVSLGQWQLRRAGAKEAAQALLQERMQLPPWRNADWPCDGAFKAAALPVHRPVVLQGSWLPERTVLLENRGMDGMSGFDVLTPLRLDESARKACVGQLVVVQRGWVPRDPRDRLHLPNVPTPTGRVSVPGRVLLEPSRVYQLGQEAPPTGRAPLVRQNVDAAFWRAWLGQAPIAGAVLQLQAERPLQAEANAPAADAVTASPLETLRRQWPALDQGQGKHLAYAAQWFALAALITGLYVWYQLIRPRRASVHAQS